MANDTAKRVKPYKIVKQKKNILPSSNTFAYLKCESVSFLRFSKCFNLQSAPNEQSPISIGQTTSFGFEFNTFEFDQSSSSIAHLYHIICCTKETSAIHMQAPRE